MNITNIELDVVEQDDTSDNVTEMFGGKAARWYQIAVRNAVEQIIADHDRPRILIHMPTGVGKTLPNGMVLASNAIRLKLAGPDRPLRVLFISHLHRLLTQAERTYSEEASIRTLTDDDIMNYTPSEDAKCEIYYHSAFSAIPSNFLYDIVVIDEAHHEAMATIQYQLEEIGGVPIIGLTATPDRPDGMVIKFDHIVSPISREQAVEEGWLARTSIHSFVDVGGVDKTELVSDILKEYADQFGQTMVFLRTQAEVAAIHQVLQELGYTSVALLKQSAAEIDNILDRFSEGHIQFIVNCKKIAEGVDVKGCTDVLIGRTLGSYTMLNQIVGRAARPDSECVVWELVDPLSGRNLDTTAIVGTPESHLLHSFERGGWVVREFDYIADDGEALGPEQVGFRA